MVELVELGSTYDWLSPKVFVTDGDPAVNDAVITEFPNTYHIHCIWHISQNLPKRLKGELGSSFRIILGLGLGSATSYRLKNEKEKLEKYIK